LKTHIELHLMVQDTSDIHHAP